MAKVRPDWLARLVGEIDRQRDVHGTSYRKLSAKAGLGPNFVTQLMNDNWREPSFDNVVRLCQAMDLSVTYLVTGSQLTRQEEEILAYLAQLDEGQRAYLVGLLKSLLPSGEQPQ